MEKVVSRWFTPRLQREVTCVRYGHFGQPVLLFPTAGGDAEECERFKLLMALSPLIDAGRIKVYSCDSVSGRTWIDGKSSGAHRAAVQNQFDAYVYNEVVPAIRTDCRDKNVGVVATGASIGAFNAFAAICRHPDVFTHAICMSGTFDLSGWMNGEHTLDFHYSSPLHFLPNLADGPHIEQLRRRFVYFVVGEGRWESPEYSWRAASLLGSRGIPNRVDLWGKEWDHDWPSWRVWLPKYLDAIVD
jgi:esterase/lipase superfamily enzyme